MGGCLSRNSSSTISSVRVVHLNGWIEDYDFPVSVSQVTGSPTKHFVFTPAQLLSTCLKPLKPDTLLEPGRLYFLISSSTLHAEVSPADLAAIVKKLTAKAKSGKAEANRSPGTSPLWSTSSPARSPNRLLVTNGSVQPQCSRKRRPWKPILDTIRERSFNRRESDLHDMNPGEPD